MKQVPINKPVEITSPMSNRLAAPAPLAIRRGITPNTMAAVVINMGRNLIPADSSTAARLSRFFSRCK
ncbi:Uncharacterised protein [Legionella pneumophila]|nr:Uncharacterised protein [Legionella pneumophila]